MNYADKMEREPLLMGRLADWMEVHGTVLSDRRAATHTPEATSGKLNGEAAPTALSMWTV